MVRRRRSARKKKTVYTALSATAPRRRGGAWVVLVLGALVVVNLYVFVWDKHSGVAAIRRQADGIAMTMPSAPLAPDAAAAQPAHAFAPVEGKVGKSDTLGRVLKKSGLSAADADEVIRALSSVLDFRTIRAGQTYHIARRPDGRVERFDLELAKSRHVRAVRDAAGDLVGEAD